MSRARGARLRRCVSSEPVCHAPEARGFGGVCPPKPREFWGELLCAGQLRLRGGVAPVLETGG